MGSQGLWTCGLAIGGVGVVGYSNGDMEEVGMRRRACCGGLGVGRRDDRLRDEAGNFSGDV